MSFIQLESSRYRCPSISAHKGMSLSFFASRAVANMSWILVSFAYAAFHSDCSPSMLILLGGFGLGVVGRFLRRG